MIATPTVPVMSGGDLTTFLGGLPLHFELSQAALAIALALVGILFATVSVVLIYHWRRFPFEQEVFARVERLYFLVATVLLVMSVLFVFIA